MVVDPEVLRRAGVTINDETWTWRDFEAIALQIFQRTGVQTEVQRDHHHLYWEHIVRQFGVSFFSPDHRSLGFTNHAQARAALVADLEMFLRLRAAGVLFDPEESFVAGLAMQEGALARGRAWHGTYWSNQHIGMENAAGRPLEYYMAPSVNAARAPFGTYLKPGQFISMTAGSESRDLAARYINFFVNDLDANRILLAERGIPIPSNVANYLSGLVTPDMKYVFDFISRITPFTSPIDPPDAPATGEVRDVMRPILLQCLLGRLDPVTAVDQMIRAANAVLSR
jgi:multiple sugar transport system substrate-binding protein